MIFLCKAVKSLSKVSGLALVVTALSSLALAQQTDPPIVAPFSLEGHANEAAMRQMIEEHLSSAHEDAHQTEAGGTGARAPSPLPALTAFQSSLAVTGAASDDQFIKDIEIALGRFTSFQVFEQVETANGSKKWQLTDGNYISITRDGTEEFPSDTSTKCDRPELLRTDFHCGPYAVVGRIKGSNPEVQWVYVVRRYRPVKPSDPDFNTSQDIALIGHHPRTGATIFFQWYGSQKDAATIPSPMTEPEKAKNFWLSPSATANINCNACHSADPFIHSPYLQQVKLKSGESVVPSDPFGPYYFLQSGQGQPFSRWAQPSVITSDGNRCVSCHRIGVQGRSKLLATSISDPASSFNVAPFRWMPPIDLKQFRHPGSAPQDQERMQEVLQDIFDKYYKPDAKKLERVQKGNSVTGVTAKNVATPPDRSILIDRPETDTATNLYVVDSRMRANTDGALKSWTFWAKNTNGPQLVIYRQFADGAGSYRFEVVAEAPIPTSVKPGLNTQTLKAPIPVKMGDYFGVHMSGAGGLTIPFSDDASWATANIPNYPNVADPYPLGSIVLTSDDGQKPDANGALVFRNFAFRTYSFEAEFDLGAFAYSTFDYGLDGWDISYVKDDGTLVAPQGGEIIHDADTGSISHTEARSDGLNWYFAAPETFVRELAQAHGQTLRYRQRQSRTDEQFVIPFTVMIDGAGKTIYYDAKRKPGTGWTSYAVPMTEIGWISLATKQAVSDAEFRMVLSAATALRIQGEFRLGIDQSYLDNVWLGPT